MVMTNHRIHLYPTIKFKNNFLIRVSQSTLRKTDMDNTMVTTLTLADAQQDMRESHVGGSGGMLVSGTVWLIAGIVSLIASPFNSVVTLFFGGMIIYPLGLVVAKLLGGTGQHQKGNPMATLALTSIALLFIGLFIAFAIFQEAQDWFFPIMMTTIGGRYIIFATVYNLRLYWLLGAVLILAGAGMIVIGVPFATGAFVGGSIEIIFGLVMWRNMKE